MADNEPCSSNTKRTAGAVKLSSNRSGGKRKKRPASENLLGDYIAVNRQDNLEIVSQTSKYQYEQRIKSLCQFLEDTNQRQFLDEAFPQTDPIHRLQPVNAKLMEAWFGYSKYNSEGTMKSKKSFDAFVSGYRYFLTMREICIDEEVEQQILKASGTYKRIYRNKKAEAPAGKYKDSKELVAIPKQALIAIQKYTHQEIEARPTSLLEHATFGSICINAGCRGDSTGSIKVSGINMGVSGD